MAKNRIDMRITDEQADILDRLVEKKGIPRNAVVSVAIKEMADRELGPKGKKPFPYRDGNSK